MSLLMRSQYIAQFHVFFLNKQLWIVERYLILSKFKEHCDKFEYKTFVILRVCAISISCVSPSAKLRKSLLQQQQSMETNTELNLMLFRIAENVIFPAGNFIKLEKSAITPTAEARNGSTAFPALQAHLNDTTREIVPCELSHKSILENLATVYSTAKDYPEFATSPSF